MIDNYNDLTVGKYQEIMLLLNGAPMDELTMQTSLIAILSDEDEDDILNLPLSEYNKMVQGTAFLSEEPKKRIVATKYILGDMELETMLNMKDMTAGQYIDYQTFIKDPDKYLVEMLSVFLIPKGKKYNDGYDILEVHNAIREHLSIVDALSMSAFFLLLSQVLIKTTLTSLTSKVKKMKKKSKNQQEIQKLEQAIQNLETAGVGFHLLTEFQKQQG